MVVGADVVVDGVEGVVGGGEGVTETRVKVIS